MKHAPVKKKTAVVAPPKVKKFQPKNFAGTVKNGAKKATVLTVQSKSKKKKPAAAVAQPKRAKTKPNVAVKKDKSAPESARTISSRSSKTAKPKISVKKSKAAAAKPQTIQAVKKTKTAAPKTSVSIKKSAKFNSSAAAVKKSKNAKVEPIALAAKKNKSINAMVKPSASVRGKVKVASVKPVVIGSAGKNKSVKSPSVVRAKKTKAAKPEQLAATKKVKKIEPKIYAAKKKPSKIQSSISAKINKISARERRIDKRKLKPTPVVKAIKTKSVATDESKAQGQKIFAAVKIRRQKIVFSPKKTHIAANKIQPSSNGKANGNGKQIEVKTGVNKIGAVESPVAQKPKKRKAKAIGAAVFRGKKARYDFQVFPLDSEFDQMTSVSGIYVISRRKTDRDKRAHHALVCIGQTDSVAGEIKRHAKNCIKKHRANVISILPEGNEKRRLKIEEDLKAAHSISCGIGG